MSVEHHATCHLVCAATCPLMRAEPTCSHACSMGRLFAGLRKCKALPDDSRLAVMPAGSLHILALHSDSNSCKQLSHPHCCNQSRRYVSWTFCFCLLLVFVCMSMRDHFETKVYHQLQPTRDAPASLLARHAQATSLQGWIPESGGPAPASRRQKQLEPQIGCSQTAWATRPMSALHPI